MEEDSLTDGVLVSDVRRNFLNRITISLAQRRPEPKTGLVRIFLESVNIEKAQLGFHDDQTTSNVFPDLANPKLNLIKPTPTDVFYGFLTLEIIRYKRIELGC
jgi:hypothetical protein